MRDEGALLDVPDHLPASARAEEPADSAGRPQSGRELQPRVRTRCRPGSQDADVDPPLDRYRRSGGVASLLRADRHPSGDAGCGLRGRDCFAVRQRDSEAQQPGDVRAEARGRRLANLGVAYRPVGTVNPGTAERPPSRASRCSPSRLRRIVNWRRPSTNCGYSGCRRVRDRLVEAAEDLLEGVVVAFAVAARQVGEGRGAPACSSDGSLRMIWLGELRWPIHSSSGRSWFQITPALVPKISIWKRFLQPADTWLAVNAPRARSPRRNSTAPKSSVSMAISIVVVGLQRLAREGLDRRPWAACASCGRSPDRRTGLVMRSPVTCCDHVHPVRADVAHGAQRAVVLAMSMRQFQSVS